MIISSLNAQYKLNFLRNFYTNVTQDAVKQHMNSRLWSTTHLRTQSTQDTEPMPTQIVDLMAMWFHMEIEDHMPHHLITMQIQVPMLFSTEENNIKVNQESHNLWLNC